MINNQKNIEHNSSPASKWSVKFFGFDSEAQAKAFAIWYNEQGEQDVMYWLLETSNITSCDSTISFSCEKEKTIHIILDVKNDSI